MPYNSNYSHFPIKPVFLITFPVGGETHSAGFCNEMSGLERLQRK